MARTKDPHAAAVKSWATRRKSGDWKRDASGPKDKPDPMDYTDDEGGPMRGRRLPNGRWIDVNERLLAHEGQWEATKPGKSDPVILKERATKKQRWARRVSLRQHDHGSDASRRYTADYEYRDKDGARIDVSGLTVIPYDAFGRAERHRRGRRVGAPARPPDWARGD